MTEEPLPGWKLEPPPTDGRTELDVLSKPLPGRTTRPMVELEDELLREEVFVYRLVLPKTALLRLEEE